jgi:transcriptional regulator with XRE-family HTH domain
MTPDEFKRKQTVLGWTNAKMARHLGKTPQSISNYRNGRQKIPEHVQILLEALLRKFRDESVKVSDQLSVSHDLDSS